MIAEILDYHSLYDYVVKDGKCYPNWTFKSGNGDVLAPAQRIGIIDKQFQYNDMIYFS